MIIPWQELAPETLDNLIKEYILREVEDYQTEHMELAKWKTQIKQQLTNNQIVIEWSEVNESVSIVDAKKYAKSM